MTTLSTSDFERSVTWNLVIAAELQDGEEASYRDEGKERKWGSLSICRQSGAWYSWAAAKGGHDALSLIRFLRPDYTHEDAVRWLVKFLDKHPGIGQLEAEDEEWTQARREATAALARHYLDSGEPLPPDSAGAAYLASRGLPGPYPKALRWIPVARPGESALIMPLTAFGRITGVMVTYIDALGEKSLVAPVRRRLDIERAPGAVMVIQEPTPGVVDISATMIIAEGFENAMSIAHPEVAHPGWSIIGVPGISTLKNVPAKPGDRIIVAQDSDPEGHPAQIGLQAAIDNLILQGAQVRRTERSEDGDANAILLAKGPAELKRLLARPAGAPLKFEGEKLSIEGEIVRLAKLSPAEYEKERKKAAKDSEWRVTALDKAVARLRPAPASADDGSPEPSISLPVDPPWTGPVPQLDLLLDRIVAAIRRHVVLKVWQAHLVAAWVALTYFVFDPRINLQVMPRLAIQSAAINSGKTALLRLVCTLVRHGKIYGRATSAGIYRALSQAELTLCLDEVEFLRNDPYSPMMQVLDSSHHREDANILLTEPQKVGPPIARELSTWAAMALACNGQLPGSLQSRSLVVVLARAMAEDPHELLETRLTPELVGLRRELTAWAVAVTALPMPSRSDMPAEVYNRDGDNWRPIYAIARLAAGEWPDRIREASLQALQTETLPTLTTRLLSSINLAFGDNPKPHTWLDTGELVARLIGQESEQWGTINRGRAVDAYWLRTQLRGLLDPPGAQQWIETLKEGGRRHHRGYFYNQFVDAFRRYEQDEPATFTPGEIHTEEALESSEASGTTATPHEKPKETAPSSVPDGVPDDFGDPVQEKAKETAADEPLAPHVPDGPDQPGVSAVCVPDADELSGAAAVSLFITQAQKRALGELGYSDEQLREMPPAVAHRLLGLGGTAESEDTPPDEPASGEQPSTTEPAKPSENRKKPPRPSARTRRAKPNGAADSGDGNSTAESSVELPDLPAIVDGSVVADEIRQIRAANPKRSIGWIAKECGQPRSVVREILGIEEGEQ